MEFLVNIDVPDLERAVAFYTRAFGFRVGRRIGDSVVELVGMQAPVYLLEKREGSLPFAGAETARSFERHWTPLHLDFVVKDLREAVVRAEAAGARREGEIATHPWGAIAYLSDPFGHGVCLIEFSDRGYDAA